jgi:hypothetical protein
VTTHHPEFNVKHVNLWRNTCIASSSYSSAFRVGFRLFQVGFRVFRVGFRVFRVGFRVFRVGFRVFRVGFRLLQTPFRTLFMLSTKAKFTILFQKRVPYIKHNVRSHFEVTRVLVYIYTKNVTPEIKP